MQRMIQYIVSAGFSVLIAGNAAVAHAQTVELVTKAEKEIEVVENGVKSKKLAPPLKMVPGDEVVYTLTYANKTAKPAERVVITNPLPTHTRYREGSASGEGADITYSVDGGKTFAAATQLTVLTKDKTGKDVTRAATAQDYSHIRWQFKQNIAPGRSGSVRFRAVIQ